MNKTILIILFMLPMLSQAQFAPYIPSSKANPYFKDSVEAAKERDGKKLREIRKASGAYEHTGGYYLQKASGSLTTSLVLAVTGAFSAGYGSYLEAQSLKPNETRPDTKPYYIAGGILGLASTVFYIRGISLLGTAGAAFDANEKSLSLYLQPRPNGAALVLNF